MKINWKIVAGLLAAGWTWDTIIMFVNRSRFHKLLEENHTLREERNIANEIVVMCRNKLRQNHIPYDAFEVILLREYHHTMEK